MNTIDDVLYFLNKIRILYNVQFDSNGYIKFETGRNNFLKVELIDIIPVYGFNITKREKGLTFSLAFLDSYSERKYILEQLLEYQ